MKPHAILIVCTGNICRSPTAHGVLLKKVAQRGWSDKVHVDSAGTHAYHVGEPPDERSQQHAARRGYDLSRLRARRVTDEDFERFDLILAADLGHLELLRAQCPPQHADKIQMLMRHAGRPEVHSVPDPYYGGVQGFEQVLDYIEDACEGLLKEIEARVGK